MALVVAGGGKEGGYAEAETYETGPSPRGAEEEEEVLGHGYFELFFLERMDTDKLYSVELDDDVWSWGGSANSRESYN